jgi:hypothetical protein
VAVAVVMPLEYGLTPREEELQKYAFDQTKAPLDKNAKSLTKLRVI